MEKDKKARTALRSSFTKLYNQIEAAMETEAPDIEYLEAQITMLERKVNELLTLDKNILERLLDDDTREPSEFEKESSESDEYQTKFITLQLKFTKYFQAVGVVSVQSPAQAKVMQGASRKYKLPQIELIKYGGEIKEWLQFWSQFRKIDEDNELAPEDKFQYLIQATIEGSRARDLVVSFPPTGDNYRKAVDGLKARFGRDDLQVEVYVRELLSLVLTKVMNKNELSLCSLYDKLETKLRALESLGVTTEKYAAMLYPLVESCMPEDLLRAWQRIQFIPEEITEAGSSVTLKTQNRLTRLMAFLRNEVENDERVNLATAGFSINNSDQKTRKKRIPIQKEEDIATATSLISVKGGKQNSGCIFCSKSHRSADCYCAKKMTIEAKKKIIKEKKCCFYCLKSNHFAKNCKAFIKCAVCEGRHVVMMCPKVVTMQENDKEFHNSEERIHEDANLSNFSKNPVIFLQTLVVNVTHNGIRKQARVMIDTGSQRSYILEDFAKSMKLPIIRKEYLNHTLFGGVQASRLEHNRYKIKLLSLNKNYSCNIEVLGQPTIVDGITCIEDMEWIRELKEKKIELTDIGRNGEDVQILMGADIAGKLYTGRKQELKCGLVAMETTLGWTVMGKVSDNQDNTCEAMNIISMLVNDRKISELWDLELIGIKDPVEVKTKQERNEEVKLRFLETIRVNKEGRYEVRLPWRESRDELKTNYDIAEKRLFSLTKKLKSDGNYEVYDQILKTWLNDGIIEEIDSSDLETGHFLPHRHVIKENSTTPVRPVFDASAKRKNESSLNDCLETGPNLIELINSVLLRFRLNRIGVIADIKRAFLQISVNEEDRKFLKFLWWNEDNQIIIYRHCRVVFGISSSPFLLNAVMNYHIDKVLSSLKNLENDPKLNYSENIVLKLRGCFYVDNCVTSVSNENELKRFIEEASELMSSGRFDLRGWEYSFDNQKNQAAMVLGLKWNKSSDTIEFNMDFLKPTELTSVTKRTILSISHKMFDPIGILCPIMIYPKLLLQDLWVKNVNWDSEVSEDIRSKFINWYKELPVISQVRVPRWALVENGNYSLHTFCDASKIAYACAVFVRSEKHDIVCVQLIQAKARIAPLKKVTIPRLELMAATVGVRLTAEVLKSLTSDREIPVTYWSDSTTVLNWIQGNGKQEMFVKNRVKEIHELTKIKDWKHIPGDLNPADLPSRGCSTKQIIKERWWEGPSWLYDNQEWPESTLEKEINETTDMVAKTHKNDTGWYYQYFSMRFKEKDKEERKGCLRVEELNRAEKKLMKLIQTEWYGNDLRYINSLNTFYDQEGIIRVTTRITLREDSKNFKYPIVLPDQHPVVKMLIREKHEKLKHAGVQILLNNLREEYWITKGRKAINNVIKKCVTCKRFTEKHVETIPCPLPIDRIRDAKTFEIVGVDYAGPLYLKGKNKVWICLYTCAVYRAIHLEIVSSLSTTAFIQALRRFIARRGRPTKIYSDNGTNFVGTANMLSTINWQEIETFSNIRKIEWRFNPPAAPWWGGFWERLVRIIKDLLKRVLGRACVTHEELSTVICECESIINNRPITYMSDSDPTVAPLTPSMFLQEVTEVGTADLDRTDREHLNNRLRYLLKLKEDLRRHFRIEYLGALIEKNAHRKATAELKVGEIVLVGNDIQKRLEWPLAKVLEIIPGKDKVCRVVKLQTEKGQLLRPVQRVYRLEICDDHSYTQDGEESSEHTRNNRTEIDVEESDAQDGNEEAAYDEEAAESLPTVNRRGRKIIHPARYLN